MPKSENLESFKKEIASFTCSIAEKSSELIAYVTNHLFLLEIILPNNKEEYTPSEIWEIHYVAFKRRKSYFKENVLQNSLTLNSVSLNIYVLAMSKMRSNWIFRGDVNYESNHNLHHAQHCKIPKYYIVSL